MAKINSAVQNESKHSISCISEEFHFFTLFFPLTLIAKISDFDFIKLSPLIWLPTFWKLVTLLIWTSWIRIQDQNWPRELPKFLNFFIWCYLKKNYVVRFIGLSGPNDQLIRPENRWTRLENSEKANGANRKSLSSTILQWWARKLENVFWHT